MLQVNQQDVALPYFFLKKKGKGFQQLTLFSLPYYDGTAQFILCIAENREPPNTPATPNMWNGCIKMFNCYA
jgi:hypothetical protein